MQVIKYMFQRHGDERGQLISLEEFKNIPFRIKRVYFIYDTLSDVIRGYHAHKTLKQVLVCVHGSCKIRLDNAKESEIILLDKPYEGLYIPPGTWREMFDFSPGAVLLVLASELNNENDYIRNYDEFTMYINEAVKHENVESNIIKQKFVQK